MKWIFFLISLILPFSLWADRISVPPGDYHIFLPVAWTIYDREDLSQLSFLSDDDSAILQISYFEGDQFSSIQEMYNSLISELNPQGEESSFTYLSWNAWLADLTFYLEEVPYRGWFLLLEGQEIDYQLTIFTPLDYYETNFPWMVSCIDSFAPGEEGLRNSGVISTMMEWGEVDIRQQSILFQGQALVFPYNLKVIQPGQDLIEREALILHQYSVNKTLFHLAWDRYYNLIYKDNYPKLKGLAESLSPYHSTMTEDQWMDYLLQWIQTFQYSSSGTFSDLLSPLASAVEERGDCDSLALLYLILLEYSGIEGVMIVSEEYSHAMAAVPSDRDGASFIHNDIRYVVAELTDQVEIGQIPSSMADLDKWQIISFSD